MKPYFTDSTGTIVIYHGDCREILPSLKADVVVTDPPYGMNWNVDTSRFSGGNSDSVFRRGGGRSDRAAVHADDEPFDPSPFLSFDEAILFGCNHFAARLPVGTTLVWIKRFDEGFGSFLSDAELAWMKGGHGVYCYRDTSMSGEARTRAHPTQKPLPLMRWCIEKTTGGTILDPFMGSGTTLRAAKDLGRRAIGIEIEERYCEIAAKRLQQEVLPFDAAQRSAKVGEGEE